MAQSRSPVPSATRQNTTLRSPITSFSGNFDDGFSADALFSDLDLSDENSDEGFPRDALFSDLDLSDESSDGAFPAGAFFSDLDLSDEDSDADAHSEDKENYIPMDCDVDDEVDLIVHTEPFPDLDVSMFDAESSFGLETSYDSGQSGTSTVIKVSTPLAESVDHDLNPGETACFVFSDMKYSITIDEPQYMLPPPKPLLKSFKSDESTFFFSGLDLLKHPGSATICKPKQQQRRQSSIGDHVPLGDGLVRPAPVSTPQRTHAAYEIDASTSPSKRIRVAYKLETPATPSKRNRAAYEVETPASPSKRIRVAYGAEPSVSPSKRAGPTYALQTVSSALKRKHNTTEVSETAASELERGRKRLRGEQLSTPPSSSHTSPAHVVKTPDTSPMRKMRMGFTATAPTTPTNPRPLQDWRTKDKGDTLMMGASRPWSPQPLLRSGRTASQEVKYLISNSGFNTSFREKMEREYPNRKLVWNDPSMPAMSKEKRERGFESFKVYEDSTATPPKETVYLEYDA